MPVVRIDSLEDPRVAAFRDVKKLPRSTETGFFIAEGPTVAERVLRSGVQVHSALISDRKFASFADRLPETMTTYRLRHDLAQQLVGFSFHCGVLIRAQRPSPPQLTTLLPETGPTLLVIGERIADPENVGALIRIAAAFGADAVVLGPGSADPYSRRVIRVSMGNVLLLPVLESENLTSLMSTLGDRHSIELCGTVLDDRAEDLHRVSFPHRCGLVFGNEFDGISDDLQSQLHRRVCIPMWNATDSLNVAVAAGIFAYQYRCQHGTSRAGESAANNDVLSLPSAIEANSNE
jgi:tRNA G18 (ribose-2'-O)-methylase SpoU